MGVYSGLMGVGCIKLLLSFTAFKQAANHHKEDRYEDHGQRGAGQNAADDAGANRPLTGRARTGRQRQWQHAQREGHGGHDDGAKAQMRRRQHGLNHAFALRLQVFGELDDQNGVLG